MNAVAALSPFDIWMISAEISPYAQTGGLGEVLHALPEALARLGHRVRRFLPAYAQVDRSGFFPADPSMEIPSGGPTLQARFLSKKEASGVVTTLIECKELFGRPGLYGGGGVEYSDNARRFSFFSRAVCELAAKSKPAPQVLHCHDWHAALAPLFARYSVRWPKGPPRIVFTIHNLAYQGRFPRSELAWLSLDSREIEQVCRPEGIEFYGDVSFLKAGLLYSDRLTTVSPAYAKEILTAEHGCGLEGILRDRSPVLSGILNGVDCEIWNPAADPFLPLSYNAETIAEGKAAARKVLADELGLAPSERPLAGVVSRLAHQKGMDILLDAAGGILNEGADLAVLGAGEAALVERLLRAKSAHPGRLGVHVGFDRRLSHLVFAASDLLLLPSRYEPCGLAQLYGLRYGALPVARSTGGLSDTVRDVQEYGSRSTGFLFTDLSAGGLLGAIRRALCLRRSDPDAWKALQARAMEEDFSWDRAAAQYAALYESLLTREPRNGK